MPFSVYLLALCQALMMSSASLMIAVSALIGQSLASSPSLATLPLSLQFLALMFTSIPASLLMGRWGRKAGFIFASLFGVAGGTIALWSILNHSFWGFTLSAICIGIFNGFGNYFRFAAVDVADEEHKTRAISYVMAGGVIAAFIGPNLANFGRNIFPEEGFAAGYLYVIAFYLIIILLMIFMKLPAPVSSANQSRQARGVFTLLAQPVFIVAVISGMLGYGLMSYVMTATPLAMQHHHHVFDETAFVIQWHVFAMFAPSFFTGSLIKRFGVLNIMQIGAIFNLLCMLINLWGYSVWHFWAALVFLGIGWNFLFIGATSLLTEAYRPEEKARAQAINDFLVFTMVTIASLSAGVIQHHFGWQFINIWALPLVALIMGSIIWLQLKRRKLKPSSV